MAFARFMASPLGRGVRIVAGLVLIAVGLLVVKDTSGLILAVVGLVPLLAGIVDICLFAPLFGGPLQGTKVRGN
jgi:hypothetical protein